MTAAITHLTLLAEGAYKTRFSKADKELIEQLLQRCEGELGKAGLEARHGDLEFKLNFLPKQQGFVLSVPCPLAGRFRVTRQGALDRWMKIFVPALQFRSRDSRFDSDFNVQTRDLELTSFVLTKQPNRAIVGRLLDRGVRAVHLSGDRVEVTGPRKGLPDKNATDDVLNMVAELSQLAACVTKFSAHHEVRPSPKTDLAVAGSWAALVFLGVSGFAMLIAGGTQFTPVLPSDFVWPCLLIGLPAIAPAATLLALAVQRRTSPYELVRLLSVVSALVVPLFISGSLVFANGVLDSSPAEERVVTVLDRKAKKNDGDMRYRACLQSWWAVDDVRWVRISKATYDAIQPNSTRMLVRTRPGRLGHEWLDGYSIVR